MNKPRVQSKKSHRFLSMLLSAAMLLGTVQAAGLWASAAEEPVAEPEPAVQAEEVSPYAVFGDFEEKNSVTEPIVQAEEVSPYAVFGDFEYEVLEDGTAKITKYTGDAAEVEIPSEIDGHQVTVIGSVAFGWSDITSATIPEGVVKIEGEAFSNCYSLISITIPSTVTEMPLASTIYDERDIEFTQLKNCTSLQSIQVDDENPNYTDQDGVLFNKDMTTLFCYPAGKTDTSYRIPNSVTSILYAGFHDNLSLTDVALPEEMTELGRLAFADCENLTTVEIPKNLETIEGGRGSFYSPFGSYTLWGPGTPIDTVRGYEGSYAQTYAQENEYEFVSLTEWEIASVREAYAAIPDASSVKVTDEEALDALQARYDALLALGVTEEEIGADTARMTAAREAIQALWEQAAALNEQMTALPETATWSDRAAVNAVTAALDELAGRGIEANSDNYSNYARYEAALQPIQAIENSIEGIENSIAALDPWKYGRSAQYEEILAQVAALESQGVASDEISNYALIAQFMELDQQAQAALTSIAEDIKALPNPCTEDDKAAVKEIQAAMDALKAAPYGMKEDELKEALNAVAGEDVYSIFQAAVAVVNPEPEEPSEPSEPSDPSKPSDGNKPANNPTTGDNGLSMAVLAALVLSAGAFLGLKKRREA